MYTYIDTKCIQQIRQKAEWKGRIAIVAYVSAFVRFDRCLIFLNLICLCRDIIKVWVARSFEKPALQIRAVGVTSFHRQRKYWSRSHFHSALFLSLSARSFNERVSLAPFSKIALLTSMGRIIGLGSVGIQRDSTPSARFPLSDTRTYYIYIYIICRQLYLYIDSIAKRDPRHNQPE